METSGSPDKAVAATRERLVVPPSTAVAPVAVPMTERMPYPVAEVFMAVAAVAPVAQ
jgi:hypothetical protein